jgi:RNA polymerase sigma-70 factor, ECF subfamily
MIGWLGERHMPGEPSQSLEDQLPRIYRVALRIVANAHAAEEVAQEVCMRAIQSAHSFNGNASWSTWLHRITVNCSLDHLRRSQRQRDTVISFEAALSDMLLDSEPSPDAAAEEREIHALATATLRQLPDDCRKAFVLTQLDGYSYDQAAEIEGVPRGTIASRVFRAKKLLLEAMPN